MLNIVIPMAGRGSRFADAGYTVPKPWIPIHGRPMIEIVVRNLRPSQPHRFHFLCLEEHLSLARVQLPKLSPNCNIVAIEHVTEGAACTTLLASRWIDNDSPLMIANSDQWVDFDINAYLAILNSTTADGLIATMPAQNPKWSYLRLEEGKIIEVVEKQVVSNEATVGIYNFRHGRDFVWAARRMIQRDLRVAGEFYVAPVYNQLIEAGKNIAYANVGEKMHGLGIPEDLDLFLARPESLRAASYLMRPS